MAVPPHPHLGHRLAYKGITELNIIGVISFLLTAIVAVILNLTESVINQQNVHQPWNATFLAVILFITHCIRDLSFF